MLFFLLNQVENLMAKDTEKAEVLNAAFALVFTGQTGTELSQDLEMNGKVWSKADVALVEEDQIREHLNKLDKHKAMGPNEMYQQALRGLANAIVRPCSVTLERSGQSGGSLDKVWKKANAIPIWKKEDLWSYRPVSFILFLGMVVE